MDRTGLKKYYPFCKTRVPQVSQYMWKEKDHDYRTCENGTSMPIYSCDGNISFTLPLNMYPPDYRQVHPQIKQSLEPHFGVRDKQIAIHMQMMEQDYKDGRFEGMYN